MTVTPIDLLSKVERVGWPYHGLIKAGADIGDTQGFITLPSGSKKKCLRPEYSWTMLWDIGLPDLVSDNPDEQWKGKAVIRTRSDYLAFKSAAIYGGLELQGFPANLRGDSASILLVDGSIDLSPGGMAYVVVATGKASNGAVEIARVDFSSASVGIEPIAGVSYIALQIIDVAKDGLSWLMQAPGHAGIIECKLSRALGVWSVAVTSVATTAQMRGTPAQALGAVPAVQVISNRAGDYVLAAPGAGQPGDIAVFPVTAGGTTSTRAITGATIWAWYSASGGVEVCRADYLSETTQLATATVGATYEVHGHSSSVEKITLTAGASSASIEIKKIDNFDFYGSDGAACLTSGTTSINNIVEKTISGNASAFYYITPVDSIADFEFYKVLIIGGDNGANGGIESVLGRTGIALYSNKMLGFVSQIGSIYRWKAYDALSPGTASSLVSEHAVLDETPIERARLGQWLRGTFNPVTGAMYRNDALNAASWV
jgi:hypothetical protein